MQLKPATHWSDEKVSLFAMTPDRVSDSYVGWLADGEVNQYLESRFADHGRADVETFVLRMIESDRDLLLGIHDVALDRHVGNIRLGPIDWRHGLGEIGIMIGDRAAWGRGIGAAAIRRLAAIAFNDLDLRKLSAGCYASNVGSRKAFESAGFTVEAIRPAHVIVNGGPDDAVLLGLARTD